MNTNANVFRSRMKEHDELETRIMDIIRPFTDRKHLPDRRVSFHNKPVSFDVKTRVFVEDNAHDEYFRLLAGGEPVFIVYQNGDGKKYGDGKLYAGWIEQLTWAGPFKKSTRSTCGDNYYRISGGVPLADFLKEVGRV